MSADDVQTWHCYGAGQTLATRSSPVLRLTFSSVVRSRSNTTRSGDIRYRLSSSLHRSSEHSHNLKPPVNQQGTKVHCDKQAQWPRATKGMGLDSMSPGVVSERHFRSRSNTTKHSPEVPHGTNTSCCPITLRILAKSLAR